MTHGVVAVALVAGAAVEAVAEAAVARLAQADRYPISTG